MNLVPPVASSKGEGAGASGSGFGSGSPNKGAGGSSSCFYPYRHRYLKKLHGLLDTLHSVPVPVHVMTVLELEMFLILLKGGSDFGPKK